MMLIDNKLLDAIDRQAAENPRLRMNYDLRTTPEDKSQRLLNALRPGTIVPIHRHEDTAETLLVLRGSLTELFYDDDGNETEKFVLNSATGNYGIQIPVGQWHSVVVTEPCVIIEVKDGAYAPVAPQNLMIKE